MLKNGFRLGDLTVYPLEGRIIAADGERRVTPLAMNVLLYLAENSAGVIERDHVLEAVWEGRAQSDEPLNKVISELRRVLGDRPADPVFIRTITKRGYQLLQQPVPIEAVPSDAPEPVSRNRPVLTRPKVVTTTAIILIIAAAFVWQLRDSERRSRT